MRYSLDDALESIADKSAVIHKQQATIDALVEALGNVLDRAPNLPASVCVPAAKVMINAKEQK